MDSTGCFPIKGAPGFTGTRVLVGHHYPRNGNAHRPTPIYRWRLSLDGRLVDTFDMRRELVAAALDPSLDYRGAS